MKDPAHETVKLSFGLLLAWSKILCYLAHASDDTTVNIPKHSRRSRCHVRPTVLDCTPLVLRVQYLLVARTNESKKSASHVGFQKKNSQPYKNCGIQKVCCAVMMQSNSFSVTL